MQSLTLNSEQNKKRIDNDQNYGLNWVTCANGQDED